MNLWKTAALCLLWTEPETKQKERDMEKYQKLLKYSRRVLNLGIVLSVLLLLLQPLKADDAPIEPREGYTTIGKCLNHVSLQRKITDVPKSIPQQISENKITIKKLITMNTKDQELNAMAIEIGLMMDKMLDVALERYKSYDSDTSFTNDLLRSALDALTGNLQATVTREKTYLDKADEIQNYDKKYIYVNQILWAKSLQAQVFAEKYSGKDIQDSILMDFDESFLDNDVDTLCLYNKMPYDLHNVTILDTLTGVKNQVQNIHYIEKWPAKSWIYIFYAGPFIGKYQCSPATALYIQKLNVKIWSDELAFKGDVEYAGENKRKDIDDICKAMTFKHSITPFKAGIIYDDYITLYLTLDGIPEISASNVRVIFQKQGAKDTVFLWEIDAWKNGEKKSFGGKDIWIWMPDAIKFSLTFETPGTEYCKEYTIPYALYPIITSIEKGSMAESVGIRTGDILLEYDGVKMNAETSTNNALKTAIINADKRAATVKLYRMGSILSVNVTGGKLLGIKYNVIIR